MYKGYTIGQFSKLTGIPIQTLRYYDRIGLLRPQNRDSETGYRYYQELDVWNVEIIFICKELGMSLEDIRGILESNDNESIMQEFSNRRREVEKLQKKCCQILKDITWYEESYRFSQEIDVDKRDIYIKNFPKRSVIYQRAGDDNAMVLYEKLQIKALRELEQNDSIRRNYGYLLNSENFSKGILKVDGEFLNLLKKTYTKVEEEDILLLPKGTYYCTYMYLTKKCLNQELLDFAAELKDRGIEPGLIVAEELSPPVLIEKKIKVEIQVLPQ